MMQAARYKQYGDVKPFERPQGVVKVSVDPDTGNLAGPYCPDGVASYFINGTQPGSQCAPQEVEVIPTSDGGVIERATPVQVPALNPPAPERSISIQVPIYPPTPTQAPPP
jgi:membrane carboxypeptidase/penicillin-binding protein